MNYTYMYNRQIESFYLHEKIFRSRDCWSEFKNIAKSQKNLSCKIPVSSLTSKFRANVAK